MKSDEFNYNADDTPADELGDDVTIPLGTGGFGADEGIDALAAGTTARRQFKSGSLLVVLVVAIAIGGLFALRTLARITAGASAANDFESTVEQFLRRMSEQADAREADERRRALAGEGDLAISVLNETYSERQVPLASVQRNPFILPSDTRAPTQVVETDPYDAERSKQRQREERRRLMGQAVNRLVVKSILMGSQPLANLNDQIVRVGDIVFITPEEIEFQVTSIRNNRVELTARDAGLDLEETFTVQLLTDK